MEIRLSSPRGFCAGVRMAIDVVDEILDAMDGAQLYVYQFLLIPLKRFPSTPQLFSAHMALALKSSEKRFLALLRV